MSHYNLHPDGIRRKHEEAERTRRYEMRHDPRDYPLFKPTGIPYGPNHGYEPCPCQRCKEERGE